MAYTYANLKTPQNTGSGIGDFIYLAPVSHFVEPDGIKCPAAPFTNPGDEVKILLDHEFVVGKKFAKVILAPEKNQLTGKTIGDLGFQKLDIELKGFIPGSYAEVHEAVKNWINQPMIVLTKDSNCPANMYYQLGCDCVYAYVKADFSTGTTKDGVKGYEITITYQNGYIQLYAGAIEVYA
jgi:hypothetical protein